MPSSANPRVTPSSIMRRSFWVSAMRVYLAVSGGSLRTRALLTLHVCTRASSIAMLQRAGLSWRRFRRGA
jgi:hypothetical protein